MKKHVAVILAFALPIVLILVVVGSVYLPSLFISTKYDFVYANCGSDYYYDCSYNLPQRLTVEEGTVVFTPPAEESSADPYYSNRQKVAKVSDIRFFLHDTKKNESKEITFDEAKKLSLDPLLTSPDGVTFSGGANYSYRGDIFFLFGSSYDYGYYLTKGRSRSKLYLVGDSDRYYYNKNIFFVGWVK